ncbi:hypothetical protein AVEN_71241-1 [Araneus ventricosus]|uniref:Uncharacterized protein n=1 Tax=Araneus ventricosus TaxID=182803 RepID=A0A4Y2Q4L7_ARAVE|nr:hypothetical protein AVEN_71241-1 [Araneus ventricosus]
MKTEVLCLQNTDSAETETKGMAVEMLSRIENEHDLLKCIIFSDETTFHVSNKVNKHSWRISGSENPHAVQEVEGNSPKINVWCALSHDTIIGQFLFAQTSVTANIYLDMMQIYAIPKANLRIYNTMLSSNKTSPRMFRHFWMQLSLTDGYVAVAQSPGHQDL